MVRLQPRHKIPKAFASLPVLIIMVLLLVAVLLGVVRMALKTRITSAQVREAKNELERLEVEHSKLVADIDALETPEGQIEAIRNSYRAGTEGEKLVVIVKEEEEDDSKEKGEGGFFYRLFHKE